MTAPLEPRPTTRDQTIDERAQQLYDAVNEVLARQPTAYRDNTPVPRYGPTPPVPQPGTPPMSQKATDISRAAIYFGLATVPPGLVATAILVASHYADPIVIGMICAAPAALAVPVLAIAKLIRNAKPDPEQHTHYHGPVTQTTTHSNTTGLWARTTNQR
jgi:hypothetical protein